VQRPELAARLASGVVLRVMVSQGPRPRCRSRGRRP
jgi:hypothetical protein